MRILDTNAASALAERGPKMVGLASGLPFLGLYLTVITVAELWQWVLRPGPRHERARLAKMISSLLRAFEGRILVFDQAAAQIYAKLVVTHYYKNRSRPELDIMIAAIALSKNAAVVTRNEEDFARMNVTVINPWAAGEEQEEATGPHPKSRIIMPWEAEND